MLRSIAALLLASAVLASARAETAQQPEPGQKAESRAKIVEQIQADYESVLGRLKKDDPGAVTRSQQQRILDGLDKLIEQQDPEPPRGASNPPPPPPTGNSGEKPMPQPMPSGSSQAPKQQPDKQPAPTASAPKQKQIGQQAAPAAPAEVRKNREGSDGWRITLPPRHRTEIDSIPRDRLIRNYEEMLRAYYRNLADTNKD
jgi:hypothetical protein